MMDMMAAVPPFDQLTLDRRNIEAAWSVSDRMTSGEFAELIRVTADLWRREREAGRT